MTKGYERRDVVGIVMRFRFYIKDRVENVFLKSVGRCWKDERKGSGSSKEKIKEVGVIHLSRVNRVNSNHTPHFQKPKGA